jgi:large subunit ribosomal protein L23
MSVLIAPVITEKSMANAGKGKYTFKVVNEADKASIKKEIEKRFSVDVTAVTTVIVKGKMKRSGKKRMEKRTSNWKKAVVALKPGQKIDLFELGGK